MAPGLDEWFTTVVHPSSPPTAVACEVSEPMDSAPPPALIALRDMYTTSRRDPEAYCLHYDAATRRVLSMIASADSLEQFLPGAGEILSSDRLCMPNALHYAAGCGCVEAAEALLQRNARLNYQSDGYGQTPLMWAVRHGLARTSELLLRHDADPKHADYFGESALHSAAARGHARICELLISSERGRNTVNWTNSFGLTPLHLAAAGGSEGVCRILVESRADVVVKTPKEAQTALHQAARHGCASTIEYLLSVSPDDLVLFRDASGATAKDVAARHGHQEVVERLRRPEAEHKELVEKWSKLLGAADVEAQLDCASMLENAPVVEIKPPVLQKISKAMLQLTSCIHDLEYRIVEYVLEIRDALGGPQGAAPARVYYARLGEQRKVDEVAFDVPKRRATGQSVWEVGRTYQFRLVGRCSRCSWLPFAPWQVMSEWSDPMLLTTKQQRRNSVPRQRNEPWRRR